MNVGSHVRTYEHKLKFRAKRHKQMRIVILTFVICGGMMMFPIFLTAHLRGFQIWNTKILQSLVFDHTNSRSPFHNCGGHSGTPQKFRPTRKMPLVIKIQTQSSHWQQSAKGIKPNVQVHCVPSLFPTLDRKEQPGQNFTPHPENLGEDLLELSQNIFVWFFFFFFFFWGVVKNHKWLLNIFENITSQAEPTWPFCCRELMSTTMPLSPLPIPYRSCSPDGCSNDHQPPKCCSLRCKLCMVDDARWHACLGVDLLARVRCSMLHLGMIPNFSTSFKL